METGLWNLLVHSMVMSLGFGMVVDVSGDREGFGMVVDVSGDQEWFPAVKSAGIADEEDAKKAGITQLEDGLALMEEAFGKCSKGNGFFGGGEIGFLDIAFGSFLGWLRVIEKINGISLIDEAKTPALVSWAERFCCHAAVKDVMLDADKLTEFGKMLFAKIRAPAGTR